MPAVLTCLPLSLCSWNYRVLGAAGGEAILNFNYWTEQGTIDFDGVTYDIRKQGALSGRWTLESGGDVYAEAYKPSAMFRRFEITGGDANLVVEAQSAFRRSFSLIKGDMPVGSICPAHAFTRRATIECDGVSELDQLFAFWLVALLWRRAQKNNS